METEQTEARKFYAYRLDNGQIHVRRYNKAALDEAEASTFVDEVIGPYTAPDRKQAEQIALEKLREAHP